MIVIERYSLPKMRSIWSDRYRLDTWLRVEIAVLECWQERGLFSREILNEILDKIRISPERMREIEQTTRHDVIAFLTSLSENLGPVSRYLHFGLTSSDMLDTANALIMKAAGELIQEDLQEVLHSIRETASVHRLTLMAGRTHGVHAEPTTFGIKLAGWYMEMVRHQIRLTRAIRNVSVGKISGAVGNFANIEPAIERSVCEKLGLEIDPVSTQIVQRDRYAEFIWALSMIASSLERFAVEIRSLQRTEIGELEEGFTIGQKGSSAMPHKKNPIIGEQICGLARILRGNLLVAMENIPLWHERDISHSSAERIILPDSCLLADYLLQTFRQLIDSLVVHADRMKQNLENNRGLVFSERVLLELIKRGMNREEAYTLIQQASLALRNDRTGRHFRDVLYEQPVINSTLSFEEIDSLFDYGYYLKHVDTIFQRAGLE
ncbi:MAG TPA: adenylosuccinate lyase [Atribacteraceae bacterium]|nr:adenylosuccinate lyase [Atribacteraceae bacterium]